MGAMRDAAGTWALVVGIDEYDDPKIPRLTGAARDAVAAAGWLRALGVPDAQILFHAAPSEGAKAEVEALGLPVGDCTVTDIWKSVATLMKRSGSRLYVFLSGHGLYEPGSKRLFLTQEASEAAMTNLGIEWYSDLLRSLRFPLQFLVMDGCLNLPYSPSVRSSVEASGFPGVARKVPLAETTLASCFAASQGERAVEADGRGLFLRTFLEALDPDVPDPFVVDLDDDAGVVRYDLRRAVREVVSPTVTDIAWNRFRRQQHPGLYEEGAGEAWRTMPVVELEPPETVTLRVVIDPTTAVPDVRQIRLDSDDTAWRRFVPVPPAVEVQVPVQSKLPAGTRLSVRCILRPQVLWLQPALRPVVADTDTEVVIRLEPEVPGMVGGYAEAVVNAVDSTGNLAPVLGDEQYEAIEAALEPMRDRVSIERHETGPVLQAAPRDYEILSSAAASAARAIDRSTEAEVGALVVTPAPLAPATVRFRWPREGAVGLAGALVDLPAMHVGERTMSLREAASAELIDVEPGPVQVKVELPWGSWSHLVHPDEGETVEVAMPSSIGAPPLRVRARAADVPLAGGNTVVLLNRGAHDTVVAERPGRRRRLDGAELGDTGWRSFSAPGGGAWRTVVAVRPKPRGTPLHLPLHPYAPVLLTVEEGPRAEPYATIPSPDWDRLVSSGRLEDLSDEAMSELARTKWEDPVLGLAGAYACFARGRYDSLAEILYNLGGLEPALPDVPVLAAARGHATGEAEDAAGPGATLKAVAAAGAVPVLRWGVPLAVHAADRHGLSAWREGLAAVDAGLMASSIWTMWRAPATRVRRR